MSISVDYKLDIAISKKLFEQAINDAKAKLQLCCPDLNMEAYDFSPEIICKTQITPIKI